MARRKNTKRIDPRYFLNETVNRGEETLVEEDVPAWFSVPDSTKRRIARHDAEDRADKRQRDDTARRRQGVKDDIEMDKWKNRDRTHSQEHGEIEEGYMSNRRGDTTQGHMTDMFNSDDPQYPGRPFVMAAARALDMGRSEALDAIWVREYEGKAIAGWVRDAIADIARRERGAGYRGDHSKANREARIQFGDDSMVGQVEDPRQVRGMDFDKAVEVFKLEPLKWDPDVYGDIYDKVWRRERGY